MQIVIDIPEDTYERVMNPDKFYRDIDGEKLRWAVYKGTVLPEHGRLIDGNSVVHANIYDDEHEEVRDEEMTVIEYLDIYTNEGASTILEAWSNEE